MGLSVRPRRVIASAALIMALVFGSFVTSTAWISRSSEWGLRQPSWWTHPSSGS